VLAEEASCTPDYVHEHTVAIDAECPHPALERRLPSLSILFREFSLRKQG
jgi:hypothetical protein